uniref:5'-nucleotidase n=1 Tax=Photinus pyralis TaxID=7054 RepID=A0A1Y1LV72_PHOPY
MKVISFGILLVINLFLRSVQCENLKLLILHNNDMHSRFEETSRTSGTCKDKSNCYGGFGRVLHVVREARKAAADGTGPPVLFLNAGDTYTGTSWFSVHKWRIAADFMNLLQPDVACFGNHEFGYKPSGLSPYLKAIRFPMLACNVDFSEEPELQFFDLQKSWIFNVDGRSIGVIGYVTTTSADMGFVGKIKFLDEIPAVTAESRRLAEGEIKTIIALGHSGFEMDKRIAREVPLVDLVIGGHTNTLLCNGIRPDIEQCAGSYPTIVTQPGGKKVPVVQAYAYTKYLGRLNVTIDDDGRIVEYSGYPQLLDAHIPQDPAAIALLDRFRKEIDAAASKIVGYSTSVLGGEIKKCRYEECTLANLVTDAFDSSYGSNAYAMIGAKSLYHDIIPKKNGSITLLDLLNAFPFAGNVYSVQLTGLHIWKTLEIGVRSNGETTGSEFVHTSGIRYKFNMTKPTGQRVVELKVLVDGQTWQNIDYSAIYQIVTTQLMIDGADRHKVFAVKGRNITQLPFNDTEILLRYFKKHSPVTVNLDGRVERVG